ncbi:hypothetical protein C7T94_03790 [Pedobacter yulinensis]|uniref:TonB-dependent receptor n=1 Tax=Pedobacter yulinensis TaxID=2126353 RepID=A0A2T3HRZ2_9SPHI|nr:hypothetical protein C7T94_03790 [Pedobacter yulinensis]
MLGSQIGFAQKTTLSVSGVIVDTAGVGLTNCNIKISSGKSGLIYNYFNTGNKNTFSVDVTPNVGDSLVVEISHVSFSTFRTIKPYPQQGSSIRIAAILGISSKNLDAVEVKAPRTWVRGDTTFHNVDAYKEGDEKKLKDILLKLPNFEKDANGQITYKKKPLDKVTIDGEELFADKIELMLNNFPVHVLDNIQAIENQSSQRLLKGLTSDNKTFINLQLHKKNKLSAGFGDAEAGIGNRGRYNLSPVLFSMYGTVKAGFIGNWNSTGNGVGFQQETELRDKFERDGQQLLMLNHPLQHINNFEQRWYIRNRQWDNRLQVNAPLNKKLQSKTEFSYIKDRQPQDTYSTSLLLNNDRYDLRIDSNENLYLPEILDLRQTFSLRPDSSRELMMAFDLYRDRSRGQQNSLFRGFGIGSPLYRTTNNNWTSLGFSGNYTVRKSSRRAVTWAIDLNRQQLGQDANGQSADIAKIFSLPDGYDQMNIALGTKLHAARGSWKMLLQDKKKFTTNLGLILENKKIGLDQSLIIRQGKGELPNIYPEQLANKSNYEVSRVIASVGRPVRFVLKNPFGVSAESGIAHASNQDRVINTFLFNIAITQRHQLVKGVSGQINAVISQSQLQPEQLYSNYYPASLMSFKRWLNIAVPLKRYEYSYALAYQIPNDLSNLSGFVSASTMPNSLVTANSYNSFIAFNDAYFINQSTSRITIGLGSNIPSLLLNAMIDLGGSYSRADFLILSGSEVLQAKLGYYSAYFTLKKNWQKKYYVRFSSNIFSNISRFPRPDTETVTRVTSWKNHIYQRLLLSKQMSIVSNLNLYHNNMFTENKASFLIADLEYNYQWKKSPLYLTLRAENLLNERTFKTFSNSIQAQSFQSIPLLGRSMYISARYTF